MNSQISLSRIALGVLAIIIAGVIYLAGANANPRPNPAPVPVPAPGGPDLTAAFVSEDAAVDKANAKFFAAMCGRIAATIKLDSGRGSDRRVITGVDIAQYRKDLRHYSKDGWRFASTYPMLPSVVEQWLDKSAGDSPDELTDDEVTNWVNAFLALQSSANFAAANR